MTNKNIITVIVFVIAIAAAGLFFFLGDFRENTTPDNLGEPISQPKINMDQVCEESVMYMTFTDAASADLFVKECKEGKHPQVLEDYKIRMGISTEAQI
jgi:hypothetical protein